MIIPVLMYLLFVTILNITTCNSQSGPDPWDNMEFGIVSSESQYVDVPPDLRITLKKKISSETNMGNGEWFFKRTLAIILNGGQNKVNDDGSVDISVQMKLDNEQYQVLNEYTKSNMALTEDMFRRAIAYIEEAIYKPTVIDTIAMAWDEYIVKFLTDYKTYIVWGFGIMAASALTFWILQYISRKHIIVVIFLALYLYEVIISYKEAEKLELDKFLSAVNHGKWFFWKSSNEISPPDPIVFMKHMNPMKIGLRMFTTILSEPMIALSATVNTMLNDITGKMWFPFDIILHSILIICINIMLIALLIMIIFNYILNVPFNLSVLGLGSIQIKQRKTINFDSSNDNSQPNENTDRISGATLEKILDVFSRAIDNSKNTPKTALNAIGDHDSKLTRSSSTGRLPNNSLENYTFPCPSTNSRRRFVPTFMIGGGDSKQKHRKRQWKGDKVSETKK